MVWGADLGVMLKLYNEMNRLHLFKHIEPFCRKGKPIERIDLKCLQKSD